VQTTEIGQKAEQIATDYLCEQGFSILDRNWKLHKQCEIDIIAQKGSTVYFVEVKYRRTDNSGAGLDYITATKLKSMRFAALQWAAQHAWHGNYELSAIEVSGHKFTVTTFVETI
jgi:putative endonuclease